MVQARDFGGFMIRFCIIGILFFLVSCAPASISSYDFALNYEPQIFWAASPQVLESFVVSFVQKFDPKFVNAFVSSDLSRKQYSVHEITLNGNAFVDTDGKPYRLTIFVAWAANSSNETSFILMNEENTSSLEFPVGTLAFGLNTELTKALDANFKRQSN
jgi:hypothetical protein